MFRNLVIFGSILLVLVGCGSQFLTQQASTQPRSINLVYTGNLDGELEPCGCSLEGNLGGVLRQVTTLDAWRDMYPEMFLLSSGGLVVSATPHDKLTGEYILKGYAQAGFDAIGVQWPDRAYGDEFIFDHSLPWVSTNGGDAFLPYREVERGAVKLAVYSWLDPDVMKNAKTMVTMSDQTQALAMLRDGLKQAKSQGKTTVLLSTMPLAQAKQIFPMAEVDILFVKSSYEVYGEPLIDGKTLVLQPGSRGMRFARINAVLDASGSISSFEHEVKSMPPEVVDSPRMLPWYQAYNDSLKEAYQASVALKKKMKSEGSPYAGAKACKSCHADAYATWKKSKHAKAFRALMKVNKAFDSACISCHVVGFEKPGGFIDTEITRKLENVQCESCHGAAAEHVASSGQKAVENKSWGREEMCAQCHVQKHSPSFKFGEYWPQISH